jgi:valyl-tRNA synthetase
LNPGEHPSEEALEDQLTAKQVLAKVISQMHLMLHPLMPHLTEELWHSVTAASETTFLALQLWPVVDEIALDDRLEASFSELIAAIRVVRNLRAVAGLKPSQPVPVRFVTGRPALMAVFEQGTADITALTRAESVELMTPLQAEAAPVARALAGVSGELQVLLPIEGLVDLEALQGRLEKDIAKAEKEIKGLAGRLGNPNFAEKAPAAVVAECKANLAEAEVQAQLARKRLVDLG